MIHRAALAALTLSAALAAPAHAATAEGLWRTPYNHGEIEIGACGDALCGRIVTSDQLKAHPDQTDAHNHDPALRTRPLKGMTMLSGFKGGPTEWGGGSVYNPQDGRTYHGTITLTAPDALKLTGCVFYPLCQSQTWTRIR